MDIQIKVPVKPYVRNYLLSVSGDEPLVLLAQSNDLSAAKLYDLIARPDRRKGNDLSHDKSLDDYTETLVVRLKSWRGSVGLHLSAEKIFRFNSFVEQLIRDRLFTQLDTLLSLSGFQTYPKDVQRCELPIDIKEVILSFMAYHDLEEGGMKWDTLKKAYQRFRNDRHERLGGALSVPLFSVLQNPEVAA